MREGGCATSNPKMSRTPIVGSRLESPAVTTFNSCTIQLNSSPNTINGGTTRNHRTVQQTDEGISDIAGLPGRERHPCRLLARHLKQVTGDKLPHNPTLIHLAVSASWSISPSIPSSCAPLIRLRPAATQPPSAFVNTTSPR